MQFGDKLRKLRIDKDLTLEELSKKIGNISKSYLSDIENNRHDPSLKKLYSIASGLNVPLSYLINEYEKSMDEKLATKKCILTNIPILGTIPAGQPILAEQNIIGYEKIDSEKVKGGKYFFLKVQGDSMINARIHNNDLVLVRQQSNIENGEIAVVMVDAENATLKRVHKYNDHLLLQPENSKYQPFMAEGQDVRIIGKVVEVRFKVNGE